MIRLCLLFYLAATALSAAESFPQLVSIDTNTTCVASSPLQVTDSVHQRIRDIATGKLDPSTDIRSNFWYLFRTTDTSQIKQWISIDHYHGTNVLLHIRFLNTIAKSKSPQAISYLQQASQSPNPILREIAASGFGILGDSSQIAFCTQWFAKEQNGYVQSTLTATLQHLHNGSWKSPIPYLPLTYASIAPTDSFLYNKGVQNFQASMYRENDSVQEPELTIVDRVIAPHQQYAFPLRNAPSHGSFAAPHGAFFHTGMDTGWLLEGLPIHAIANGRVRGVQHESTWGTLVIIESALNDSTFFTTLYGHMDPLLDVRAGDEVVAGQKIGMIGRSFTLDNGGYVGHLHLGIEMSQYWSAHKKGYDPDIGRYRTVDQLAKLVN